MGDNGCIQGDVPDACHNFLPSASVAVPGVAVVRFYAPLMPVFLANSTLQLTLSYSLSTDNELWKEGISFDVEVQQAILPSGWEQFVWRCPFLRYM